MLSDVGGGGLPSVLDEIFLKLLRGRDWVQLNGKKPIESHTRSMS